MRILKSVILGAACLAFLGSCQKTSKVEETTSLGTIDFKVTSNVEAIESFEKGVLLLHSFMYDDAATEFKKAQAADPDFAMAFWGEAMTYNHPLWSAQNYEKATKALSRLAASKDERMTKAPSDFEKDMLGGTEVLYGEGTKIERDDLYAQYMGGLYEKYPSNHEVAAFYALSLLGSVEEGRDFDVYGKGAQIVDGILKENPKHPGALHYMIHSYDDPEHAPLALEAANNYSKVAPDAGHALHMPSHIYVAMGMWDNVISSNIRSFDARLNRVEENSDLNWNLHAYSWLMYGYLQKGDQENVQQIMDKMNGYVDAKGYNTYTKSYLIDMVGNYLAETNNWDAAIPSLQFETEKMNIRFASGKLFIEGYQAYAKNDRALLNSTLAEIDAKILLANNELVTKGIASCAANGFASRPANQDDIDMAKIMSLQLQIAIGQLENKADEEIEKLMIEATELESKVSFSFGPPTIVIPTYEMYGKWLLEKGRYEEALAQFDRSLEKGPGRRHALIGKLEAAKGLDNESLMNDIQSLLSEQSS